MKKQPLQSWLWDILASERCPGVRWEDKTNRIFKIPWQNMKTQEWREEDAIIFIEYAKHTKRFKEGENKDYPKFKQNFKSAVNKNRFIKPLKMPKSKTHRYYMFTSDCGSQEKCKSGNSNSNLEEEKDNEEQAADLAAPEETESFMNQVGQATLGGPSSSTSFSNQSYLTLLVGLDESPPFDLLQEGSITVLQNNETDMSDGNIHVLHDLEHRILITNTTEDDEVDSILQNLNISVQGEQQIQNMSVDSTTTPPDPRDVYYANPGDITDHSQDFHNPTVSGLSQREETEAAHGILSLISGRVKKTSKAQRNQQLPSFLTETSRQTSPDSPSSMDTSEEHSNLNRSDTSISNFATSGQLSEPLVKQVGNMVPPHVPETRMHLQITYGSPRRVVGKELIKANKCKIFYGKVDNKRIQQEIKNRDQAFLVELPSVDNLDFDDKSKTRIGQVLERMKQGVLIYYRDDDIYVVRRCQSRVFLSDGVSKSECLPRSSIKEPDQEVKAFDFDSFKKSIANHKENNGPIDRDYFLLTFGCEILVNDASPTRFVPVFVVVQHYLAADMRFKELGPSAYAPDPQHSLSDSLDNEIRFSNLIP